MPDPNRLVLTRIIAAPRERVFAAFTRAEQLARWWGPFDYTSEVHHLDARVGGAIRLEMRSPSGLGHPMTGTFEELAPPERLVFLTQATDERGGVDLEVRNTITLVERDGATELTLVAEIIGMTAVGATYRSGMAAGWGQSLDRLAELAESTARAN